MFERTPVSVKWGVGAAFALLAACGGGTTAQPPAPEPTAPEVRQLAQGSVRGVNAAAVDGTYHWKGSP